MSQSQNLSFSWSTHNATPIGMGWGGFLDHATTRQRVKTIGSQTNFVLTQVNCDLDMVHNKEMY